jgi:hypothetical protein
MNEHLHVNLSHINDIYIAYEICIISLIDAVML